MRLNGAGASEKRYCTVQVRMWNDEKFKQLSKPQPNAQTLWQYLLTGPCTSGIPGVIINRGRAALAEDLGWEQADFDRCFQELVAADMAIADWQARVVYLVNAFDQECNKPFSTSVVVKWRRTMNEAPECALIKRIDRELQCLLKKLNPAFLNSYRTAGRTDLQPELPSMQPARLPAAQPAASAGRSPDPDPDPLPVPDPDPTEIARARGLDLGKAKNAEQRAVVDRWLPSALSVFAELNEARRRVKASAVGLRPTYDSLHLIARRLEAGKTVADCRHVIAVYEAESRVDGNSYTWFNAITPFRPDNFEMKLAASPADVTSRAGPPRRKSRGLGFTD